MGQSRVVFVQEMKEHDDVWIDVLLDFRDRASLVRNNTSVFGSKYEI